MDMNSTHFLETDNTLTRVDEFDLIEDDFDFATLEIAALMEDPILGRFGGGGTEQEPTHPEPTRRERTQPTRRGRTHREPTPEQLTPTRLRPRINASHHGQDNNIVNNAMIRRAQMADIPVRETSSDTSFKHPTSHHPSLHPENQERVPSLGGEAQAVSTRTYGQRRPSPQDGVPSRRYLSPPQVADGRPFAAPGGLTSIHDASELDYKLDHYVDYSGSTTSATDTRDNYRPPSRQRCSSRSPIDTTYDHNLPHERSSADIQHTDSYHPSSAHAHDPKHYDPRLLSLFPHEERPDNYFACECLI
jgi:hypothetical protein